MRTSLILLTSLMFYSTTFGLDNGNNNRLITDLPNTQLMVHRAPNINFSVTNFGFLGSQEGEYEDVEGYFDPAPGAMFPAGSGFDYLFQGAIWIGAEIDTFDQYGNPILDTLVSIGNDGWWGNIFELWPEENPSGAMWRDQTIADEEIYAEFYDTCAGSIVIPDPFDGPHIPLGLKITQQSIAWSSPGYNEFIILNYTLENIGPRYLHNTWVGIYYDGDVLHKSEGGQSGAQDDICGYIQRGDYGIGWIADNDGEPTGGAFDTLSPIGVLGMSLLGSSAPGLETNFNWWISNVNSVYDWGPQRVENYNGPYPCGGNGTPCGDKAKYQMMSNGEHDYGQMWSNLEVWENNGWIPRSPQAANLADGYDTRFLISFGPFDLPAGQSEILTVALIGGSDFHIDPLNFSTYLEDHTFDSTSIAQYYANLGFGQFIEMADSAISYYEHGYANIPPGPPPDFRITEWSENHVAFEWNPISRANLLEYRIYRGTEPGVYDPQKLTPDGFLDSMFVDSSVLNNNTYFYVILSANTFDIEGGYSHEAVINTGQPQTPTGLSADGGNTEVELNWNFNLEPDIMGYIIYRSEGPDTFDVIDTSATNTYTDVSLGNGLEFYYYITAFDSYENVSYHSDTVSAFPMGLDDGILLIGCTNFNPLVNPDFDSMQVFYENILENYTHAVINHSPQELPEVAEFSTLIYSKELIVGYQRFYGNRLMLENYLNEGGNIILAGTRHLVPSLGYSGTYLFDQDDIESRFFNLAGVELPDPIENMEFTGGSSSSPLYNDFVLDSTRISRIVFPPGIPPGRLNGIGALIPNDSSEVIYSYVAVNPDTSNFHGRPIGIVHQTDTYNTAVLEFPLYYVKEPTSYEILHQILTDFGEAQTGIGDNKHPLPRTTGLSQNYPNPFNNITTFKYSLAEPGKITITIYNILGQKVAQPIDEYQQAGVKTLSWSAEKLPSGIYFARMSTESYSGSIKLLLLK